MALRSWLFVPGDSEDKLFKAGSRGADAVVVDLEDSVAASEKPRARAMSRDWLEAHRHQVVAGGRWQRWVRINGVDSPYWRDDIGMVMSAAPDGLVIAKTASPEQLQMIAGELYELEQHHGIPTGSTKLMPQVGESPAAALNLNQFVQTAQPRLVGLTWGAEDLASAIGASRKRDAGGQWTDVFRHVRAQILLASHARGVAAVDTVYSDFRNLEGLKQAAAEAAADGFTGMLAIHPDQIPVINEAFKPSPEAIEEAQAIVDAFSANPHSGVLQIDGKMIEQPHLDKALRLLESLH